MKTLSADEEAVLRNGLNGVNVVGPSDPAFGALLSLIKRGLVYEMETPMPGVSLLAGDETMIRLALRLQDAIRRLAPEGSPP